MMGDIAAQPKSREVWEVVEDWSYAPENPAFERPGHAELFEFWLKPGMQEDFQELVWCYRSLVSTKGASAPAGQGGAPKAQPKLRRGAPTKACGMRAQPTGIRTFVTPH